MDFNNNYNTCMCVCGRYTQESCYCIIPLCWPEQLSFFTLAALDLYSLLDTVLGNDYSNKMLLQGYPTKRL